MNAPDAKVAEQLWLRAHEHIRRGNLAQAVRDLAKSFEILKAVGDPRLRQVHGKWVAVHKLYQEEAAARKAAGGQAAAMPSEPDAKTLQAEAEAAANRGDLDAAMSLYEKVLGRQPENELAQERLVELRAARARASELSGPQRAAPAQPAVSAQPAPAAPPQPVQARPAQTQPTAQAAASHGYSHVPAAASRFDTDAQVAFLEGLVGQVHARRRASP